MCALGGRRAGVVAPYRRKIDFLAYPVIAATASVIAVLMMLHLLFSQLYLWYRQERERSGRAPWAPGSKTLRRWLSVGAVSQNIAWFSP